MEKKLTNRRRQALATKERIRAAALELFSEAGFRKVTMESICRRAQVSKGLFYNYFPTKSAILLEGFRDLDASYARMAADFRPGEPVRRKLLTFLEHSLRQVHKDQINLACCKANYYETVRNGDRSVVAPKRYVMVLGEALSREARETGQLHPGADPDMLRRVIQLLTMGAMVGSFLEPDQETFIRKTLDAAALGMDWLLPETEAAHE